MLLVTFLNAYITTNKQRYNSISEGDVLIQVNRVFAVDRFQYLIDGGSLLIRYSFTENTT